MPKRNRILKGSTVLLVAVATGCAVPTPGTTTPGSQAADAGKAAAGGNLIANNAGGLVSNNAGGLISNNAGGLISNNAGGLISNNAGGLISNNAGGLISNNAGGLISNNAGGLISNNAGGLISNNAGGLTGAVRGPAAGLISNNAGGLISNNAGGLISNNAGGLISNNAGGLISNNAGGLISNNAGGLISNNAGGLISNNAGGYSILQAAPAAAPQGDLTAPVANCKVGVFNERDEMISYSWTTSDEDGNYVFTRLKASGPLLFVKAIYEREGQQVVLVATAPAPRKPGLVNCAVTPATTIVAKKFGQMVRLRAVNAATLRPSTASKIAATLAPLLSPRAVVAAAIFSPAKASETFDNVMAEAPPSATNAIKEVASVASVPTVVATTPSAELPQPPAAPANLPPEDVPNVTAGTGDAPAAADAGAPPAADAGAPAPSAGGAPPSNDSAAPSTDASSGGAPAPSSGGAPAAGGAPASGGTPAAAPASALKATVTTLAQARSGKRVEVKPGTGQFITPSSGGAQTGTAADLKSATPLSDDASMGTAFCYDADGTRYQIADGNISWAGGSVKLQNFDPGWATDLCVKSTTAYVTSKTQNCIFSVDLTSGATTVFAGLQSFYGGFADGQGQAAQFNQPSGIALASDGLWVTDVYNRRVRKVDWSGTVTSVAGSGFGSRDGVGAGASFLTPTDIAVGADGSAYVTDQSAHRLRKVTPDGTVTTICGTGLGGDTDGTGDTATLLFPTSVSVGKIGGVEVLVIGENNGKVRMISNW